MTGPERQAETLAGQVDEPSREHCRPSCEWAFLAPQRAYLEHLDEGLKGRSGTLPPPPPHPANLIYQWQDSLLPERGVPSSEWEARVGKTKEAASAV